MGNAGKLPLVGFPVEGAVFVVMLPIMKAAAASQNNYSNQGKWQQNFVMLISYGKKCAKSNGVNCLFLLRLDINKR